MDSIRLCLFGQPAFEALARAKSPEAALLYAHAAAAGGTCTLESAREALGLAAGPLGQAAVLLRLNGLAEPESRPPREAQPATPGELADARERDPVFRNLCACWEAAKGDLLRRPELEALHHIYSVLALPADVLVLLINHIRESHRTVSARELERQANRWHDEGIDSYDRAEAYLAARREQTGRAWAIRKRLGIQNRQMTDTEKKYIELWADQGLADELIGLAYDRTVVRTGRMSWAYMGRILADWQARGLGTVAQVEQADRPPDRAAEAAGQPTAKTPEAAVLRAYAEKRRAREQQLRRRLDQVTASSPEFAQIEGRRRLCASRLARAEGPAKAAFEGELARLAAERTAALAALGRPADWLDDRPDCPECGDQGYVGNRMCRCFQAAVEAERRRREGKKP